MFVIPPPPIPPELVFNPPELPPMGTPIRIGLTADGCSDGGGVVEVGTAEGLLEEGMILVPEVRMEGGGMEVREEDEEEEEVGGATLGAPGCCCCCCC